MRICTLAAAALAAMSAAATAGAPGSMSTGIGDVLVGANGMTLYTFKKDTAGVSNCYDGCADLWPPLYVDHGDAAEGAFSIISRKDGTQQWAKDGMPLYYWVKDQNKGDTTGDGVKDVWLAARP